MDHITPATNRQVSSIDAYAQVAACSGMREVSDSVAVTIAAMWHSPGSIGRTLAALASGLSVDVTELLDDIYATRTEARRTGTLTREDATALDALATWAINHPSRQA